MGDSLRTAWNKATIMRSMVLIGSFLACVSSVPFDAGYGVPAAPLIASPPVPVVSQPLLHSIPAPAAPFPVQLLHAGPVLHQAPIPFPQVAPAPLVLVGGHGGGIVVGHGCGIVGGHGGDY